jgi:hypothetical protein
MSTEDTINEALWASCQRAVNKLRREQVIEDLSDIKDACEDAILVCIKLGMKRAQAEALVTQVPDNVSETCDPGKIAMWIMKRSAT